MKGAISIHGQHYYTYMDQVFNAIDQAQLSYNWLISNYWCNHYPDDRISFNNQSSYEWISGKDITDVVIKNKIQFIFGVFSAFDKNVNLEDVLKYDLPYADGYKGFWAGKPTIQHPLADIEIVPWDSTLVLFIARNDDLVNRFVEQFPCSEDLERFNSEPRSIF